MPTTPHNDRALIMERRVAIVLLIVVVAAVYLPIVNQQFSGWDDVKFINAVWKPGWQRAWKIITDFDLQYTGEVYYNPLHMLSLMADQLLSTSAAKPSASVSKLMNVVYHAANSVLVFFLMLMAGTRRRPAFIGALIFAVHPVQVGTVAWVAERKNLLAALFYLASVMMFLKYLALKGGNLRSGAGAAASEGSASLSAAFQNCETSTACLHTVPPTPDKRLRYLVGVILCFAASLLAKPSAVTLPVVLATLPIVLGYEGFKRKEVIGLLVSLFVMALGWGAYVLLTERTYSAILPAWPYRPFISAGAFWFYVSKLLIPVGLVPIYPRWNVTAHIPAFSALLATFLTVIAAIAYFWRKIDKWILWGILFFAINLVLVSGLIPFGYMSHSFVADHFLYLPMVGVALIIARGLEKLFNKFGVDSTSGKLLMVALYVWVAVLGVASVRQTWLWRNPLSMWEATLKANPNSFAANNNLGLLLMTRGDYDRAFTLFKRASELAPGLDVPYFNMGDVSRLTGDTAQAKKMYAKTIQINPGHIEAIVSLAEIVWKEGKRNKAIEFLKKFIKRNPRSGMLHNELGLFYYEQGAEADALREYSLAIELDPFLPLPYIQKGAMLLSKGLPDQAIPLLKTAVTLKERADAYNVLGAAYAQKGQYARALEEFRAAYKIRPGFPGLTDNIANALIDLHDYADASRFCSENGKLGMPCAEGTLKRIPQR
jgi:protein O-mannosyl-transferase